MQVQMQMAVDVIERQACGAKLFKLSVNFVTQLFKQAGPREIAEAGADGVFGKFSASIDQSMNSFRRQGGMAAQQREMQTDTEPWIFPGKSDGPGECGFVHHQACRGQNAFAV